MAEQPPHARGLDSVLELLIRVGVWVAVGMGVGLRLTEFLHKRSLWIDEAFLALNVLSRGYLDLLGSLDWVQMAPPGFLWMERTAFLALGSGEWALRAGPLLAGIALLVLMVPIARRLLHPTLVLPVVASVAFMSNLIRYSSELKPYGFDALAAAVLLLLTLRILQDGEGPGKLRIALATLPLFSLPTAFLGAGTLAALALRSGRPRIDRPLLVSGTVWAVACAVAVIISDDPVVKAEMTQYWGGTFLLGPDASWAYLQGLLSGFSGEVLFRLPGAPSLVIVIFFALLVLGFSHVARTSGRWGVALMGVPFAAALTAVLLRQYPFAGRLWLWSLPYLALLSVAGGYRLLPARRRALLIYALVFTAVLVGTRGRLAVYFARNPNLFEHSRPVITELEQRLQDRDVIYVFARATPAWLYYRTDWEAPPDDLRALFDMSGPDGPIYVNAWDMPEISDEQLRRLHREDFGGHQVLLGRSTGFRIHQAVAVEQEFPTDPDWAPSEIARIRASSENGCAWLMQSHVLPPEWNRFEEELDRQGAVATSEIEGGGVRADRYCFPD